MIHATARLKGFLETYHFSKVINDERSQLSCDRIPLPPKFYAVPRYLAGHPFVGRRSQLETLTDWAAAADPNPCFLFEAIGGSGKSMISWEWVTNYALDARAKWEGRFWYSFYERGAVMADFCRHALAYMSGDPLEDFRKKKTTELADLLITELNARPWLLVLDGLERVLVAYNRSDAPQLRDEDADTANDLIAERDPCSAIRSEDDDLLRRLAASTPSKILLTSRLTPRALLNPSGMPLPGVRREILPGLRPGDGEEMIRACGITGTSKDIRNYLQENCDCHPLVIGVLAGLINDYLPDRGNFDRWSKDQTYGKGLNLAELNLVQRRNHILETAFSALSEPERELLFTLALTYDTVDYATLCAFNPYLPPKPTPVPEPKKPILPPWETNGSAIQQSAAATYDNAILRRREYLNASEAWSKSDAVRIASRKQDEAVRNLEKRGLLQYDTRDKRYDLHPVVRGVAVGRLRHEEKTKLGQRVVDYFSQQTHVPYEQAETLKDVACGLQVVRGYLQMGQNEKAISTLQGGLGSALLFNLEAHAEILSLLQPLFFNGWHEEPFGLDDTKKTRALSMVYIALACINDLENSLSSLSLLISAHIKNKNYANLSSSINGMHILEIKRRNLSNITRLSVVNRDLAALLSEERLFVSRVALFRDSVIIGRIHEAEEEWQKLDPMGRKWSRGAYRPGCAERLFADFQFRYRELREDDLLKAETLAHEGRSRLTIRLLHNLRGRWHLSRNEINPAIESFREAVRMARNVGIDDPSSEALLALARFRAGDATNVYEEAERLSAKDDQSALYIAELWYALGKHGEAATHALRAHRWAVADGEPYVRRYELDRTRALLAELGAQLPPVPLHDPSKDKTYPWEGDALTLIEELRARKLKKESNE